MSCPLYKSLKTNGTTFYAFPSAAEDISAAYQNSNYKMYFSKYTLLNLPKQNLEPGTATASKPVYFDFDNSADLGYGFKKSFAATPAASFSEQIIESLRNYVANQEVTIKESKLNNTEYYYDNNALETTTEKIFFKWCKKLNIIDFEPAIPDDEYFSNLAEFQSGNVNDDQYFPEYLWKEREIVAWTTKIFSESSVPIGKLEVEFTSTTNFRVGDIVKLYDYNYNNNGSTPPPSDELSGISSSEGIQVKVLSIIAPDGTSGQKIIFDISGNTYGLSQVACKVELVYNRLVRYIGEVQGVSNVQQANRSYTEVHAHIPDHTGQTPDILFRTMTDVNYMPNKPFPIIPSQYQPEIIGAESFNSPIVNTPQNYPGSYFGQYDTADFTYETAPGDSFRRSGRYYGIDGNINSPIVNGKNIDGITMDFNTSHYVKMNILGRNLTNFDQFNALEINNLPPVAFEFNAILWYYTVEDNTGKSTTNLYGISFLDHPDNNVIPEETSLRFPTYKKFVTNGIQDGTSFAFSLNLNFNIINENPQDSYNPEAINSMFSMNLFNSSMSKLAATNDSFINLLAEQGNVRDEVNFLKGLIYTQTDLATLNTKIQNLESLLRLYSTNQILSSETIDVTTVPGTPPYIQLDAKNTSYERVYVYNATDMYSSQGIIPANLAVPNNRDFLVHFINNDEVELDLPNNDKLTFIFDRDLYYRQSVDINIVGGNFSTQNKMLDIYMNTDIINTTTQATAQVLLAGSINLPVYYNSFNQQPNSSYLWNDFKFEINLDKSILLDVGSILRVPLNAPQELVTNSIKPGDVLHLNNLFVGTSSIYDFSGQYTVQSVDSVDSYIILDISSNASLVNYGSTASLPLSFNSTSASTGYLLSNMPYFSFNKGKKIRITRVSNSDILKERYTINIEDIK
jgi:hypothetical protein